MRSALQLLTDPPHTIQFAEGRSTEYLDVDRELTDNSRHSTTEMAHTGSISVDTMQLEYGHGVTRRRRKTQKDPPEARRDHSSLVLSLAGYADSTDYEGVVMSSDERALERATLHLINLVAYASHGRGNGVRLNQVTGLELPSSDIRLLQALSGKDEGSATTDLASKLGVDLSQASRQITRLVTMGHVARTRDPADRRRALVTLTPETSALMDRWLSAWVHDYLTAVRGWSTDDLADLTEWLELVRIRLDAALPHPPESFLSRRWQELSSNEGLSATTREFLTTTVRLVVWIGLSGGYNSLLSTISAPIRQNSYFALRVIWRHGPLSIADVGEHLGVEPSQASKRISLLEEFGLIDRAVDGFDRRSNLVRSSRKGAELIQNVQDVQLVTFVEAMGQFDDARRSRWQHLTSTFTDRLTGRNLRSDDWIAQISPNIEP